LKISLAQIGWQVIELQSLVKKVVSMGLKGLSMFWFQCW